MTTTVTKSIAARIPFEEYIRVLQSAVEAKLSVSDYLILQLDASKQLSQQKDQLSALQEEANQLRQEVNQAKKAHQNITDKMGKEQAQALQWEAKAKEAGQQSVIFRDKIRQCEKRTAELTGALDALTKSFSASSEERKAQEQQIAQLTNTHAHMTRTNAVLTNSVTKLTQENTALTTANASLQHQLTQENTALTTANASLQHQLTTSQTDIAKIRENAQNMYAALLEEHNRSKINYIPKPYWAILNQFMTSIDPEP